MEKRFKVVLIVFAVLFSAIAFFFYNYLPVEIRTVEMYLTIGDYTGFNVDTDAIYFGTVPEMGKAERKLNITNTADMDIIVHLSPEGNISGFFSVSRNDFVIKANSTERVIVMADIPRGTEWGQYTGTLYIEFRRVIF